MGVKLLSTFCVYLFSFNARVIFVVKLQMGAVYPRHSLFELYFVSREELISNRYKSICIDLFIYNLYQFVWNFILIKYFHFKYFIDKSIGLDNRLCLYKSSPTTRWNNLNTIYIRHRAIYPSCIHAIHLNYQA
jgi:hypothetical protein